MTNNLEMLKFYLEVKSVIKTYKKFNTSRFLLIKFLKQNNLPIYIDKNKTKRYTYDVNYFEKIDSKEKAYFLGFLFADGYNNEKIKYVELTIAEQDKEILVKLKNAVKFTGNITTIPTKEGRQTLVRIKLFGKISKNCSELGMYKNKTYNINFPNIEPQFYSHFIRGYFDGDGCITFRKDDTCICSFTGQKNFLEEINKFFLQENPNFYQKITFTKRHKDKNDGVFSSIFTGNLSTIDLFCFMYKDTKDLFLHRKYVKFKKLLSTINQKNYNIGHQSLKKEIRDLKIQKMTTIMNNIDYFLKLNNENKKD